MYYSKPRVQDRATDGVGGGLAVMAVVVVLGALIVGLLAFAPQPNGTSDITAGSVVQMQFEDRECYPMLVGTVLMSNCRSARHMLTLQSTSDDTATVEVNVSERTYESAGYGDTFERNDDGTWTPVRR